jgi:hypothetical protein
MTSMEHMLAAATPWLHEYGYAAVAGAVLFEGAGVPLPGVMLIALSAGLCLLFRRGASDDKVSRVSKTALAHSARDKPAESDVKRHYLIGDSP